jgi:hypothetical protein
MPRNDDPTGQARKARSLAELADGFPSYEMRSAALQAYLRGLQEYQAADVEAACRAVVQGGARWFPSLGELVTFVRRAAERRAAEQSQLQEMECDGLSRRRQELQDAYYHGGEIDRGAWLRLIGDLETSGREEAAAAVRNRLAAIEREEAQR